MGVNAANNILRRGIGSPGPLARPRNAPSEPGGWSALPASGTEYDSAALEYICLDYIGGQTMAQRLEAVGAQASAHAARGNFLPG
jgi:hypothetical protein